MKKLDKFFGISAKGSTVGREITAGVVTFLAMAYILTVNPIAINALGGLNSNSLFLATAIGAVIGCLLMAFVAKMPLAQASGMGLNFTVGYMLSGSLGAFTYANSMLLIFISGVLFLLLTVLTIRGVSIRELVFDGIPESIRKAISVGIGLFIAFIGLQNCGLLVDSSTLVDLAALSNPENLGGPLMCLVGVIVIAVLSHFNVKGAVIIGILVATVVGIPFGITQWSGASWDVFTNFKSFFSFDVSEGGYAFALFTEGFDFTQASSGSGNAVMTAIMTVISFCMVDMFDTMGTVVGCCTPVGLVDEKGKPVNYNGIMLSDSIATCAGAMLGTSTVTTFVESGSGVAAGGRTGLTALSTAVCFLLAIFIWPVIASIPGEAASCALVYVGCLMVKGAVNVKVNTVRDAVATFFTIAMMPLAYSITDGIGFGILSYSFITILTYLVDLIKYAFGKKNGASKPKFDLSVVCIIVSVLFLVYFFVPTSF